jgi:methionyl-tRNA synthetase
MIVDSMVNIDKFFEFDIRVGKIIDVKVHEKTRKSMYVLKVDLGEELGTRTIVAGIGKYYSEEQLLDKYIACIINLDTKIIAGIESQGMLLAADDDEKVSLLIPDKEVKIGSKIR